MSSTTQQNLVNRAVTPRAVHRRVIAPAAWTPTTARPTAPRPGLWSRWVRWLSAGPQPVSHASTASGPDALLAALRMHGHTH